MDAEAYRADSRERWEAAAAGWARRPRGVPARRDAGLAVAARRRRPAAGPHGARARGRARRHRAAWRPSSSRPAARRSSPTTPRRCSRPRRRARRSSAPTNVEIRPMDAEWIDLPTARVDAVLCRWGYMLLADPEAALRETRRVLRPGGRVALAAWAGPEHNPWIALIGQRHGSTRGLVEPDPPDAPGPFAFGRRRGRSRSCSTRPASTTSRSSRSTSPSTPPSLDDWWDHSIAHVGVASRASSAASSPAEHYELRDAVDAAYAPYVARRRLGRAPGPRAGGRRGRVRDGRDRGRLPRRCDGSPRAYSTSTGARGSPTTSRR